MEENSDEESVGASSAASGGSSSEIEIERPANKRLKLEKKKKVDRISDLPDCLIQHILSFLPSTKEAIQTGILSKRWKNQWTLVPVLIFYSNDADNFSSDRIEILCPNLELLSIKTSNDKNLENPSLPDQTIEKVLSSSPLLHTLELLDCRYSDRFVIASKSLKKLVLGVIYGTSDYDISCPGLEELNLDHFLPVAVFDENFELESPNLRCLAMKILEQVQHVKLLEIGSLFIKLVLALELEGLSSPLLNCKYLTLDGTDFDEHLPGIVCVIQSSPALEQLVIKLQFDQPQKNGYFLRGQVCTVKKHCNSVGAVFNCSVSNLKTVKIVGLSKRDVKHTLVFNFVEFLLKNARMLEKIVIVLADRGTSFLLEVSKKLLSFQKCFPHTTIQLMCSN